MANRLGLVQVSSGQGAPGSPGASSDRFRTLYYVAAAVLAALSALMLFGGLWFSAGLRKD